MNFIQLLKIYSHDVEKNGFYQMSTRDAVNLIFWARLFIGGALGCISGALRIRGYLPIALAFFSLIYPATIVSKATNIPMRALRYCNLTGGFSAFFLLWILIYSIQYTPQNSAS